ncbi:hypothetical protein ACCQ13_14535 [Xanthomonas sp. NCPPB 1638]|uniref:hypothetical protein n=1 Tax=Xanthomonas sp. NCPPB 1638 TaxID=487535 RepID=UPI0035572F3F
MTVQHGEFDLANRSKRRIGVAGQLLENPIRISYKPCLHCGKTEGDMSSCRIWVSFDRCQTDAQ